MFTLLSWYYYTSELKPCRRKTEPRCLIQINNLHCYTIFCFVLLVLFVLFHCVCSIRRIVIPKSELECWILYPIAITMAKVLWAQQSRNAMRIFIFVAICVVFALRSIYVAIVLCQSTRILFFCQLYENAFAWMEFSSCCVTLDLRAVLLLLFYLLLFPNAEERLICFIYFLVNLNARFVFSCDYTNTAVSSSFFRFSENLTLQRNIHWLYISLFYRNVEVLCSRATNGSPPSNLGKQCKAANLESIKDCSPLNNNQNSIAEKESISFTTTS